MACAGSMALSRIREEAQLINGKLTREHELKCMQLDRTAALVARLKEHLAKTQTSQVALSRTLGLSPQNTSLILRGTNCPNSETTLQIALEILRTNNQMDDQPKTLHLAKERISEQAEEIKQLKSLMAKAAAPAVPPPTLPKPTPAPQAIHPTPAPKPAVQQPASPAIKPAVATTKPAFDMLDPRTWNGKLPAAIEFPLGCDSPKAITEYISGLSTENLRCHLNSSGATTDTKRLQQKYVLKELQTRKSSR
jgi:hypothetical protein